MAKENHIPNTKWFKSGRVSFEGAGKVDAESGIIPGVIMCQVGEAKGHDVWLEQEFIDSGIAYAQKHHSKIGMKARFGHPSMSNETLGTEMGRFKNFRVESDKMIADLHLFESANLSPTNPGMRDWMLSMAQEDPAAIMCSIVFNIDHFYQYDENGEKVRVWEYDRKGRWISANSRMKVYVALKELLFCDIVDQGAATDRLFSSEFNKDKFSVIATEFLNEYPQVDAFVRDNPDKLLKFLQERFNTEEGEKSFLERFKGLFEGLLSKRPNPQSTPQSQSTNMNFERSLAILTKGSPSVEELTEIRKEIEQYTGANEKFTKDELDQAVAAGIKPKQTELDQATARIQELTSQVEKLEKAGPKPANAPKPEQEKLESAEPEEVPYSVQQANKELGDN